MTIFIMIIIVIKFKKWTFYLVVFPSWYFVHWKWHCCWYQHVATMVVWGFFSVLSLSLAKQWNGNRFGRSNSMEFYFLIASTLFFFNFFAIQLNTHALCYNCTFDYNTKTEITTSLKMCVRVCIATEQLQCNFVQFCENENNFIFNVLRLILIHLILTLSLSYYLRM